MVVPPEELVADRDRGHTEYTEVVGGVGGGSQRELDLGVAGRLVDGARIETGPLGNLLDVLGDREVMPLSERVTEGRQRELAPTL